MKLECKKKKREQYEPIYFTEENFEDIYKEHNDPMVISVLVHNILVKWVLVNQGSSIDILYFNVVEALGLQKGIYKPYNGTLIRFARGQV